MNKLDKSTMAALGLKRNEQLTAMLEIAPSNCIIFELGWCSEQQKAAALKGLCDFLSCSHVKLRFVANVAVLIICPCLKHLPPVLVKNHCTLCRNLLTQKPVLSSNSFHYNLANSYKILVLVIEIMIALEFKIGALHWHYPGIVDE